MRWHACDHGDCATLRVPLDRTRPDGRTIALAVARGSKADPAKRIGSLLVNPGGPGASGLDILDYVSSALPPAITDRFDVVAWDPRGTGKSAPVNCGKDLDARFAVDSAPDSTAELAQLEAAAQHVVDQCVAHSGELVQHVSTADTVQDLDALRAALGDERLTYLGFSYGTYIGALYAQRYPERVRALVLDGALDPARSVEDVSIEQAQGFEASFDRFARWCAARRSCAFHGGDEPAAAYDALQARVDTKPLTVGSRTFGPTQMDIAVSALLYSGEEAYGSLASGLHALEQGRPGPLLAIYDSYVGRSGGTYDAEWPAFVAISCADGPNLDRAATEALQARARTAAPRFGAASVGLGYECADWPYPPTRTAVGPVAAATTAPIVVVGTRGDPATPFSWARSLATELGNARLVAFDGTTHTATLNGSPCLDRVITRYLVDGRAPADGTTCS